MSTWTIARVVIIAAGCLWFVLATLIASDSPPGSLASALILLLFGFPTAVAWIIYSIAWPGVFRAWWRGLVWLTVPAIPFFASVGFSTGWPMAVRVWLCEEEVREYAESVPASPDDAFPRFDRPERVGTFDVYSADELHGVMMLTTGYEWFDSGGIIYAPDGLPGERTGLPLKVRHLYGPWYRFIIHD